MWTTTWPGGGQPADLQNWVSRHQNAVFITSQNTIKTGISSPAKEYQLQNARKCMHYFWTPSVKKNTASDRWTTSWPAPFFGTSHVCFFLCFFAFVLIFFKVLFCFFCFSSTLFFYVPCSASFFFFFLLLLFLLLFCFLLLLIIIIISILLIVILILLLLIIIHLHLF